MNRKYFTNRNLFEFKIKVLDQQLFSFSQYLDCFFKISFVTSESEKKLSNIKLSVAFMINANSCSYFL